MSAAHAKLGASSAERWMNCPGSVQLIASLPPGEQNRTSSYARQGSAAHRVAELCIARGVPASSLEGYVVTESAGVLEVVKPAPDYTLAPGEVEVDEEMTEAVQVYLDEIATQANRLRAGAVQIEQRVYPLPSRPEMFGTADFVLFDPIESVLVVDDYKHGAGIVVEAEHNPQTMYYGLGSLRAVGVENVEEVILCITQPRARHSDGPVRRWHLDPRRLLEWGDTLEAAAAATEAPNAKIVPGDWCRFCPAAAICPALRRRIQEEARVEFSMVPIEEPDKSGLFLPDPSQPEQLAQALNTVPLIDAWAREVEGMAQRVLERGGSVPGYKLVRKRANRQWQDADAIPAEFRKVAKALGGKVKAEDVWEKKLRSPAKIEKLIGKDWVAERAHKPEGGLTIARETDPRPAAAAPAVADFAGVAIEDDLLV